MNLKEALSKMGNDIVQELTNRLMGLDKVATGNLIRSLDYRVDEDDQITTLRIIANEYLKWIDEGRRPGAKRPPIRVIRKWIDDKPIKVIGNKDSVAFLISKSIGEKGWKPTNIINQSIDKVILNDRNIIGDGLKEEFYEKVKSILESIKK